METSKGKITMKRGRPTKYTPEMILKSLEYINSCGREATELPTIEGLALYIGVDDTTILKWGQDNPEFLATIKELKHKQKTQLINDGMYGGKDVNATMAIFLLKVNHEMVETEKKILAGDKDEPIKVEIKDYGADDNTSTETKNSS